jgi:DNA-binding CsgD family transcriptional regulator
MVRSAANRYALTEREEQILLWMVDGRSSKSIGIELEVSFRTVEKHRANIMAKLHVRSARETIARITKDYVNSAS